MKDKVKASLIDATLQGQPLFVVRRYGHWAIATTDFLGRREEFFHWKETYNHIHRTNAPTLKEALELVDAFWDSRVTTLDGERL